MSSVRGGVPRGRGRGSSQPTSTRGRGSSSRGRVYNKSATHRSTSNRGAFEQPSLQNEYSTSRAVHAANRQTPPRVPSQSSAFGTAKTRGSWQERYQTLTKARERERADAIRHGHIADPDKPRALAEAVTPVGTCQDMCAEYERVQRVVQKDVWDEELNPNHSAFATTDKEPDEARMVKKFRRAAAGLEEQLPSDLRPPHVLKRTCDYLFDEVIGNASSLAHVHHFVWDRTRAIRNDFSIQQVTKPDELQLAIECYERIARFHILSLHQLALPEKPYSKYDWQQEREQLDRTLLSLMQYYDDSHGRISIPNEAEFRAYCVIFQLQDPTPDLEDRVQTWSKEIIEDQRVQKAVDLYMAACNVMDAQGPLKPRANHLIARQDWQRFWTLVSSKEVSYLMACVAEIYFNLVRRTVLNALFRTFRTNSTMATPDWTVDTLCDLLAFDDEDQVYSYCESFGFNFKEREDGQIYLDLTSLRGKTLPEPSAGIPKQSKSSLVEEKRLGRTLPAVINGLSVKQAQDVGLVHEDEGDESMEDAIRDGSPIADLVGGRGNGNEDTLEDDESLFIPETAKTALPGPPLPSALTNGTKGESQSVFNGGFSSASTFGKPSNFGDHPSIFTKPADQRTPAQIFTSPVGNSTPKFDLPNPAPSVLNTTATPAPLFKFPSNDTNATSKQSEQTTNNFSFGQPSTTFSSVFAKTSSPTQSAPRLSFTTPPKPELPDFKANGNGHDASHLSKSPVLSAESRSPSPEQPKAPFVFGQPAGTPALPPASSPTGQSETKLSTQHQPTSPSASLPSTSNNHTVSSSGLSSGAKRSSFSTDTKPKKPSPLSNSINASDENSAVSGESLERAAENKDQVLPKVPVPTRQAEQPPQRSTAKEFDALVTRLADELFNDPDVGLLKQYIEYAVSRTIKNVHNEITTERNNQEADDWRRFTLHQKYGKRWKDLFWQRRHAKTGRERRERRQRRLQLREGHQAENSSLYEGSSLHGSSREGSQFDESVVNISNQREMGNLASTMAFDSRGSQPNIHAQQTRMSRERPVSSQSREAPTLSREFGHKRLKSTSHIDGRGRITKHSPTSHPRADLLKRSSFLSYSAAKDGSSSNKNTSMSNYFRLKAMGLGKIDSLSGMRGTKRRSESMQISSQTSPPALRSSIQPIWTPETYANKSVIPLPSSAPSRPAQRNDDDEALFARLRAAREGLKESVSYFHAEAAVQDTLQRSMSSQSSTDSPLMVKARPDARLRTALGASQSGANNADRGVPAYRLRESKFVPREHYGRAIERAKEVRESRSRETSRAHSRIDQRSPDGTALFQQFDHKEDNPLTAGTSQVDSFQKINGVLKGSNDANTTSHHPISNPFTSGYQAPVSFSDHTTQLSSDNPFLQATASNTLGGFATQPAFGFKSNPAPFNRSEDHTVAPSQIKQSLANSFGTSSGFGKNHFQPVPAYSPIPPQKGSYMHSEAISLISDDEDEAATPLRGQIHSNPDPEEAAGKLLDEATDDKEHDSYDHADVYAIEARQDEDAETESQGWNSQVGDGSEDESRHGQGYIQHVDTAENNSASSINGFSDEDDAAGFYADVDEDDTQSVDERGDGYRSDDEDEDDEEYQYPDPEKWPSQGYGNPWTAASSSKNSALQDVGNSAEEAIELSD